MIAPVPASLTDVSEKTWQSQIMQLAKTLGYKTFHPFDSRRSAQGWPDLSLVRDRLVLLENLTERQQTVLEILGRERAGVRRLSECEYCGGLIEHTRRFCDQQCINAARNATA